MREVAAECSNPALLFSGGKDSVVLLRIAEKAFRPGKFPFPLVHVDTGHNFPEVIEFRDRRVAELGERLIVGSVEDSIKRGTVRLRNPQTDSRNAAQAVTLLETIAEHKFDACIGGARRDEEKARAKERIFSVRDDFGQWDAKKQRPELFDMLNGKINVGENVRVFPISNWTELDVWNYIKEENMAIPSIYFSHQREIIERDGMYWPASPFLNTTEDEVPFKATVRFRTVGDMTCTAAVLSEAVTIDKIIEEIKEATISERGARIDDKRSEAAMEKRKQVGYF
jgi:sulfate adenylyltransferase subunit 2